jgi:hypothetical protein
MYATYHFGGAIVHTTRTGCCWQFQDIEKYCPMLDVAVGNPVFTG